MAAKEKKQIPIGTQIEIVKMYQTGCSANLCADKFDVDHKEVTALLRRVGVWNDEQDLNEKRRMTREFYENERPGRFAKNPFYKN